jgi:dTDP-4-amino-4,6-dideoxygalactose transaminase
MLAAFVEIITIRRGNSKYFQYIFEAQFKKITGIDYMQSVPSNRSGIYLLLTSLGISKGDEVILTGYTCSAVTEPIVKLGAVPIFVDITADNYCLNIASLEKLISPKTRVIIAQHTYGIAAPILEIVELAKKNQLFY